MAVYRPGGTLGTQRVRTVLLCLNRVPEASHQSTLAYKYAVTEDFPVAGKYQSVSGSTVHEMVHLIDSLDV